MFKVGIDVNSWDVNLENTQFADQKAEKVKNSSPKKLSADCWSTVGRQLADCRLLPFTKIFCQQSADCWQHVGNLLAKCRLRTPVEYQKSLSSQGRTLHIDAK